MVALLADLTWRIMLLSAVFAADLLVFIGICRQELREWRVGRYAVDEPVAKVVSIAAVRAKPRRRSAIVEYIVD